MAEFPENLSQVYKLIGASPPNTAYDWLERREVEFGRARPPLLPAGAGVLAWCGGLTGGAAWGCNW